MPTDVRMLQAAVELKRQSMSGEINSKGDLNNQRASQTNAYQRAPQTSANNPRVPQSGGYSNTPAGMQHRY